MRRQGGGWGEEGEGAALTDAAQIRDLLSAKEAEVRIRETPEGAVFLQGAVEESVSRPEELLALIAAGDKRRTVAKTSMNDTSSRSHSIVTITIKQKLKGTARGAATRGDARV